MSHVGVEHRNIVEIDSLEHLLGKELDYSTTVLGTQTELATILGSTSTTKHRDLVHSALPLNGRKRARGDGVDGQASSSCVVSYEGKLFKVSRPAVSYTKLIRLALTKCKRGRMVLGEIYEFITMHFPYYRFAGSGWKNSVRHALSTSRDFLRIPRPLCTSGKGSEWCLRESEYGRRHLDEVCGENGSKDKFVLSLDCKSKPKKKILQVESGWPEEFKGIRPNPTISQSKRSTLEFLWEQPIYTELPLFEYEGMDKIYPPIKNALKRDTMLYQDSNSESTFQSNTMEVIKLDRPSSIINFEDSLSTTIDPLLLLPSSPSSSSLSHLFPESL